MLDRINLAAPIPAPLLRNAPPLLSVEALSLFYGEKQALIGFDLYPNEILASIGPSGCGKSTALKCLNRMHDGSRDVRITGAIRMGDVEIHDPGIDPSIHRRRFGRVAQKPNPFPASLYENVAYGAPSRADAPGRRD